MKQLYSLTAPCHFGLEAVLKREITDLGYDVTATENGKVTFAGDAEAIVRANLWLRTAERVLLDVGSFRAESFEDLFQGTAALPLEELIPKNGKFWVTKATSINSKVFSPSDIQSVMKKAMVKRLGEHYGLTRFPEDGKPTPSGSLFTTTGSACPWTPAGPPCTGGATGLRPRRRPSRRPWPRRSCC